MFLGGKYVVQVKSMAEEQRLWALSDFHLGNRGCHEELLDAVIAKIAEDHNARWIGLGDYLDLISMRDKRFDPEAIAGKDRAAHLKGLGDHMRDRLIEKLAPIKDKGIGLIRGNHEFSYDDRFDRAIVQDVCTALSLPYFGYSCFVDLVFRCRQREETFRVCAHHGAGYAATKGGKLNKLLQFMRQFAARIYLMGHVHTVTDDEVIVVGADEVCEHLVHTSKVGVVTGTFLKTYPEGPSGYGERKLYEPVPLGSPCVVIVPGTGGLSIQKPWGLGLKG